MCWTGRPLFTCPVRLSLEQDDGIVNRRIGDAVISLGSPIQGTPRSRDHEEQSIYVRPYRRHGTVDLLRARRVTQQHYLMT
ncbi:hypothetical protein GCM10007977_046870 [Dactylosporangium sucinum]|uniref:Uncharacterized protein n=1 Tax=Dactylosporangium sucinum TaxID=1424081 RepID=A0A917TW38_9ACTN|nr:hypothetical protein GCM10007977_046870 [Dactylosporangium sucinum]